MKKNDAHCHNCEYFYITWDKKFPYGCKAMDFKSKKYPLILVKECSGMICQAFKHKNRSEEKKNQR